MDNTDLDLRWRKHVVADFVGYALRELRGEDLSAAACALRDRYYKRETIIC